MKGWILRHSSSVVVAAAAVKADVIEIGLNPGLVRSCSSTTDDLA